jgi:hypothetical protein
MTVASPGVGAAVRGLLLSAPVVADLTQSPNARESLA